MSNVRGIASFVCGIFRDVRRDSYAQLAILEEILSIATIVLARDRSVTSSTFQVSGTRDELTRQRRCYFFNLCR